MGSLLTMVLMGCRLWSGEPTEPTPVEVRDLGPVHTGSEVADASVAVLQERLEAEGWTVQRGELGSIPLGECCSWDSCYARNPSSHYAMYRLPLSPHEAPRSVDPDGLSYQFRLRPDEAVVFIGQTPPPAAYFSFRTYVHESFDPEAGEMSIAFSSLGDSMNQLVLGTLGDSGAPPFGATTVVMSVADASVESRVRAHLVASGLRDAAINVDVVPPERAQLGLGAEDDTLRMNLRMALFSDPAQRDSYLASPPGVVLRLTPPEPVVPLQPMTMPALRPAGGGPTEHHLQPAVDALRLAVRDHWREQHLVREATVNTNQPPADAPCWPGCNSDSTYGGTPRFPLPLMDREVHAIVYGVNHEASGLASYANTILMGQDNNDPAGFVDSRTMVGSARRYLPDHPDVDQLYVWRFSRECVGDPHCSEVSVGCPGLTPREPGRLQWRTYLDPRTATHVDSADMVLDGAFLAVQNP